MLMVSQRKGFSHRQAFNLLREVEDSHRLVLEEGDMFRQRVLRSKVLRTPLQWLKTARNEAPKLQVVGSRASPSHRAGAVTKTLRYQALREGSSYTTKAPA